MNDLVTILLAAGQGTRFKSKQSKVLAPILGKPMFYYPLQAAFDAGCSRAIIVVGRDSEAVTDKATSLFPSKISCVVQPEQLGTGHAVNCALENEVSERQVLILYGDVPSIPSDILQQLITLKKSAHVPLALITATPDDPHGYGRIIRNANNQVTAIVEHADLTEDQHDINEINAGIYLVDTELLLHALSHVSTENKQQEYYLPDIVPAAIKAGGVEALHVSYEYVNGVNDRTQFRYSCASVQEQIIEKHEQQGVSFWGQPLAQVEPQINIGMDSVIGPGVILKGDTKIGENVTIEGYAYIEDATIADNCTIKPYSHIQGATVDNKCSIGPFTRLRPGAQLDAECKIGNFVEIKNSQLSTGVKAGHLAYLGDAEIGSESNIGAGTITCNYDGKNKHKTKIGKNSFIGSNATLVAPVDIGDKSYVGAGSTITINVPSDTLAIGRNRQINKERYFRKR